MKKYFGLLFVSVLTILLLSNVSVSAEENSINDSSIIPNIVGGWAEEEGSFINNSSSIMSRATVRHTGQADYKGAGTSREKRAHGWTTWQGAYHYTTAQMTTFGGKVLANSGRKWGTNGTEVVSGYVYVGELATHKAKTFYGQ